MSRVDELWRGLRRQVERPVFRRVDESHPLDLYAGLDIGDHRTLMLLSDIEPPVPPEFESLTITRTLRADGRWVLSMRVDQPELAGPFTALCNDIIESLVAARADDGPRAVLARVYRWKKLLQLDQAGLSAAEARGLLGELLVLERIVIPRFGALAAIRGWMGPSEAPQDFRLPGFVIEVKTCQTGASSVVISSLDQLESTVDSFFLVVIAAAETTETDDEGITLAGQVSRVRNLIASDQEAIDDFELRLAQAGYAESDAAAKKSYRPEQSVSFRIGNDFPRLIRSSVPRGIKDATYTLNLNMCDDFRSMVE